MKYSIWDKRIPTFLAIILLGVCIGLATVALQYKLLFFGNAAPSQVPENIQVSNITDTSFTVTYTTKTEFLGSLSYGLDKNTPQVALDDRDQSTGIPMPHNTHSITIKNLRPKSSYYFSIKSGDGTYLNNNTLFQTTTGPHSNDPPTNEKPLTGVIITATGTPGDVLIFVQTTTGQLLSTLVKPTGFFILPLNTMRDKTLSTYIPWQDGSQLQITAMNASHTSLITFSTGGENTVPAITLSKNYDFTDNGTISSSSAMLIDSSHAAQFSTLPLPDATSSGQTAILTPKNNAGVVDAQPEFKGTAGPNETVEITIHSDQTITAKVTTSSTGLWSFRPAVPLSPGLHTITVKLKDPITGLLKTIQQSFTVYAQGSQVNQSATPSATPTVTIPVFTSTPTITPTVSPTSGISVTSTITGTGSITPTPTLLVFSSPGSSVTPTQSPNLVTGNETIPWIGILGIVTVITGMVLFFATQGSSL